MRESGTFAMPSNAVVCWYLSMVEENVCSRPKGDGEIIGGEIAWFTQSSQRDRRSRTAAQQLVHNAKGRDPRHWRSKLHGFAIAHAY